ncbi:MAG: 2Fe-2S iron-sulfur cluster binding domain-containing protein [Deltaproteobacteria bacterium]|nr:2Fe-2S iron-sulfur cluster binding domain-containing protein [Deltaproteobacteria bacterium]
MPKVTFLPSGVVAEVPPGTTILAAARGAGAPVGSACGGACACSTCHVWVKTGLDTLSPVQDDEDDILDKAFDVRPVSRLACQAKVGGEDIECEITRESLQAYYDEHPDERQRQT